MGEIERQRGRGERHRDREKRVKAMTPINI